MLGALRERLGSPLLGPGLGAGLAEERHRLQSRRWCLRGVLAACATVFQVMHGVQADGYCGPGRQVGDHRREWGHRVLPETHGVSSVVRARARPGRRDQRLGTVSEGSDAVAEFEFERAAGLQAQCEQGGRAALGRVRGDQLMEPAGRRRGSRPRRAGSDVLMRIPLKTGGFARAECGRRQPAAQNEQW